MNILQVNLLFNYYSINKAYRNVYHFRFLNFKKRLTSRQKKILSSVFNDSLAFFQICEALKFTFWHSRMLYNKFSFPFSSKSHEFLSATLKDLQAFTQPTSVFFNTESYPTMVDLYLNNVFLKKYVLIVRIRL